MKTRFYSEIPWQNLTSRQELQVDLPCFESSSIATGDEYRPDLLLLTTSDKRLYNYIIELTVDYESNPAINANRKKAK